MKISAAGVEEPRVYVQISRSSSRRTLNIAVGRGRAIGNLREGCGGVAPNYAVSDHTGATRQATAVNIYSIAAEIRRG